MHTNHPPVTGSRQTLLVLRILRVSLHVMFAFLLIFGAVLAFIRTTTPAHATCICLLVTALAATYLTGTIYENHRGIPTTYTHNPTPHQKPPRFAPVHLWLTVITALWLTLMTLDSAFTWVVFPIMFLYLHLLTPISGVTATLILCALAQGLSSIVLVSRAAASSLANGHHSTAAEQLDIIHTSATSNLAEARRFIKDLSSPTLQDPLPAALSHLAATTQETQRTLAPDARTPFTVTFTVDGNHNTADTLPPTVSAALLRVAQGALANVTTHSNASQVTITLSLWPQEVTLDIFDNGHGFVLSEAEHEVAEDGTGYGLPSLRTRLAQVGGTLSLESTPATPDSSGSTIVTARVPFTASGV